MLKKRIHSFKYAFQGLFDLFKSQPNALIELVIAVLVIAAGIFFSLNKTEWLFVVFAISGVLTAEAFNTAIEYLTDLASPEFHPLAGKAKDAGAAAVLITAIGSAIVGVIIFLPKILSL